MEELIMFICIFVFAFIINYLFNIKSLKKRIKGKEPLEIQYLIKKYKLDLNKIKYKKLLFVTSIINSLIISITSSLVIYLKEAYLQIICAFGLLILLIIISYYLLGKYYITKGLRQDV